MILFWVNYYYEFKAYLLNLEKFVINRIDKVSTGENMREIMIFVRF